MKNMDWSVVVAAIAVLISVIGLGIQRNDINKQAKYQRDTFILQNIIDNNKTIIKLIGELIDIADNQFDCLAQLSRIKYANIAYLNKYKNSNKLEENEYNGYKPGIEKYIEIMNKYRNYQAVINGKIQLIILSSQQEHYSVEMKNSLFDLTRFLSDKFSELTNLEEVERKEDNVDIQKQMDSWIENMNKAGIDLIKNILNEAIIIQDKVEKEKDKLL